MAHYQVFIPGASPAAIELERVGLGSLCEDEQPQCVAVDRGPDNKPGAIFAWRVIHLALPESQPAVFGYEPRLQRWTPMRGGEFYLGAEPARPVTPLCIARPKQQASLTARLADGNEWRIPVTGQLPRNWGCDDSGKLVRQVQPQFAEFCRLSEEVFTLFYETELKRAEGEEPAQIEVGSAWEYCCQALALNYRVTPAIISWLA
jgi:hypothetical protein